MLIEDSTSVQAAQEWLRSVAEKHLPINARRYKFSCHNGEKQTNMLGLRSDLKPFEGKVVDQSDEWLLVKDTRKSLFFVALKSLLEFIPKIGSKVVITPYARRRFDGERLDAPINVDYSRGYKCETFRIGENISKLPIDVDGVNTIEFRQMIEQLERLPSPDGIRTIVQMLIDAGASNDGFEYNDPTASDIITSPPFLQFHVSSEKYKGYVKVLYMRGPDSYTVELLNEDMQLNSHVTDIFFEELGEVIFNMIDDEKWQIAKVEELGGKGIKAA